MRITLHSVKLPASLNRDSKKLVVEFAEALGQKLDAAQEKYGYSNGWRDPEWMDECRAKLREHIEKGDPRDTAAYCAFLWWHGEPTTLPPPIPLPPHNARHPNDSSR